MNKSDVQRTLESVHEARLQWGTAHREFRINTEKVLMRLLHEAAANYMSPREVARGCGLTVRQVHALMTKAGMDGKMRKSKRLLAEHAAEALATNADLLGVHPSEIDLMSPLAYLPAGESLRQQVTDKTTAGVTELEDEVSGNGFAQTKAALNASIQIGIDAEQDWDGPSIKPEDLTADQIEWLASWLAGEGFKK